MVVLWNFNPYALHLMFQEYNICFQYFHVELKKWPIEMYQILDQCIITSTIYIYIYISKTFKM